MISFAMNGIMAVVTILCVICADPASNRGLKINIMFLIAGSFMFVLPLAVQTSVDAFDRIWPGYWLTILYLMIFGVLTTIS